MFGVQKWVRSVTLNLSVVAKSTGSYAISCSVTLGSCFAISRLQLAPRANIRHCKPLLLANAFTIRKYFWFSLVLEAKPSRNSL